MIEPVQVHLFPALWMEFDDTVLNCAFRFIHFGVLEPPLLGQARLNRDISPLGEADIVFVFLRLNQQTKLIQLFRRFFPSFKSIKTDKIFSAELVNCSVWIEYVNDFKPMTLT